MMLCALSMPLFFISGLQLYLGRRRARIARAARPVLTVRP
jgi:hypothetical protein